MKKNYIRVAVIIAASFLLLTILGMILWVKAEDPASPAETISAFHKAALKGEIEASKQYIDPNVLDKMEKGTSYWVQSYPAFINDYQKKYKTVKPIKNTEKITGETATIDVKITYKDSSSETKPYLLIKKEGEWKITAE